MAEDKIDGNAANGSGEAVAGMPQLLLNAQYVKDLSFENPRAPQSLIQPKAQPEVSIEVDVKAGNLAPDVYEVTLTISAEAKAAGESVFIVELAYAGVVTVKNATQDMVTALILVETPRLLFPFARGIIATATRDGGFPPLLINPIDFAELLRRRQAQGQQPGATAIA
ncbi:MAG TPA: protein-export chaperone SecB [Stellaceae bacterium]|nr:protein-export chaperone SecB [Stellaceae bacterium]